MAADWSPMPRTKRASAAGGTASAAARTRAKTSGRTDRARYAPRRSASRTRGDYRARSAGRARRGGSLRRARDGMRQLSTLDAQFLAVESARTYGNVGGLAIYAPSTAPRGELTIEDLCRLVGERLHLLPPLRWRLARVPLGVDLPYWVEDPDFALASHTRESAAPPPGDDRRLAETVSRIFARPLDRGRPLWEIYMIHGLAGGHVALLTKIHHAVVDGVSGNEILSVLLDPGPEGRELPPDTAPPGGERMPNDLELLGRGLAGLPRQPLRALRSIPTT